MGVHGGPKIAGKSDLVFAIDFASDRVTNAVDSVTGPVSKLNLNLDNGVSFTNTSTFTIRLPKERNTHTYEDTILTFNINLHFQIHYQLYHVHFITFSCDINQRARSIYNRNSLQRITY